ncbi:MAG: putative signal transducing protein [Planctomycetota bacterium]|jgi:hypothetical protein
MSTPDHDDLVVLTKARSELEAQAVVAMLEDAGIDAVAFGAGESIFGFAAVRPGAGVPVQVRQVDLQAARDVLAEARADATSHADEATDEPFSPPARMPWPARIAFGFTVAIVLLVVLGMILVLVI